MIAAQQEMELFAGQGRTTSKRFEVFDCPKTSLLIVTDDSTGSVKDQRKLFVRHP